jgi:Spy/CpxP family protein refolding chaperone
MKRLGFFGVMAVVVAFGGVVGCEETPPAQSPTTTTEGVAAAGSMEDDQAQVELKTHHRHHHAGFAGFLLAAVETVGITPEQEVAIDKIKADFRSRVEPVRAANSQVVLALADGIAAGSIDTSRTDAAVAAVGAAAGQVHGATADALNALHAALTPEQRSALVDKVLAHWSLWKESNAGDQARDNAGAEGHIARLATEIGLTADQVDKVRAALAAQPPAGHGPFDPATGEAHAKAFAAAFVGAQFDAKTLTTADPANTNIATWGSTRMVRFYQALAPVLTAEQRTKVSASLREHANEP